MCQGVITIQLYVITSRRKDSSIQSYRKFSNNCSTAAVFQEDEVWQKWLLPFFTPINCSQHKLLALNRNLMEDSIIFPVKYIVDNGNEGIFICSSVFFTFIIFCHFYWFISVINLVSFSPAKFHVFQSFALLSTGCFVVCLRLLWISPLFPFAQRSDPYYS